ncbi:hypothetical protein KEM60_03243 [Austwickia sp. TVS 96-490-7B]|uniref:IS110 family transposase n=1 Tax=Austwickia sp. TVS 96-490-7B TaxID=2830843 RepID=UPI001C57703B|nr:IS110 family transposase [Austwickia sp. TVS 96-490-7B]MBW3087013.1 hypothetical protein [Austwickia sp. TVS 96-490-7B]
MSMQQVPAHRRVIVGVDTHKYIHVAVAIDDLGTVLDSRSFAADSSGYAQLAEAAWIRRLRDVGFGVSSIAAVLAARGTPAYT